MFYENLRIDMPWDLPCCLLFFTIFCFGKKILPIFHFTMLAGLVLSSCITNRPTMHTYVPELLCLVLLQTTSPTVVILSNCSDSLPLITVNASIRAYVFCSPMSLVHSFSAYLHSLFLEACIWVDVLNNYIFEAISSFPCLVSGNDSVFQPYLW